MLFSIHQLSIQVVAQCTVHMHGAQQGTLDGYREEGSSWCIVLGTDMLNRVLGALGFGGD